MNNLLQFAAEILGFCQIFLICNTQYVIVPKSLTSLNNMKKHLQKICKMHLDAAIVATVLFATVVSRSDIILAVYLNSTAFWHRAIWENKTGPLFELYSLKFIFFKHRLFQ